MKLRILRQYGELKVDAIIEATGNTQQFLLQNGIACVANVEDKKADKKKPCDCGDDCEDCKSKKKKRTRNAKPTKQKKPVAKKTAKKSK